MEGGERRQESVGRGLAVLSPASRGVLVHDAARPLTSREDAEKVIRAVREHGAAVLGHPSIDSVKEERKDGVHPGFIARDLVREATWMVQTPQGAAVDLLRRAHREAIRSGRDTTDEAGLLSAIGLKVRLVEGSRTNIKITFPEDLRLAEFILRELKVEG